MAKLVYALNQSLDGYVDHMAFAPDAILFRHFIDDVRSLSASCTAGECTRPCAIGTTVAWNGEGPT